MSEHDDSDICEMSSDVMIEEVTDIINESNILQTDDNIIEQENNKENLKESNLINDLENIKEISQVIDDNVSTNYVYEYKQDPFNVGDVVLTRYYSKKTWKYYIGMIESVDFNTRRYSIFYFKTVGKTKTKKFVKHKRIVDTDIVPENSIVKIVELLQVNETPDEYVLMNDEDNIYF